MPTASQTAYTAAAVLRIRNNLSQAMGAQANVRDFLIHDSLTECFNLTGEIKVQRIDSSRQKLSNTIHRHWARPAPLLTRVVA